MATVPLERFIQDYSDAMRQGNAAIFAGAGLSVAAGFVDWKGLLQPLAEELNLDMAREHDLVRVAQYHVNHHSNRNDLAQAVLNQFSVRTATVTENHRILARLPISVYWTTNYDRSIELALEQGGKLVDVKHRQDQLVQSLHDRDAIVYKMHGDCQNAGEAILAKEDYERFHLTRGDFLTALAGDLLSKTFLFIGFSFSDPNMDYVLARMFTRHGRNQNKHFCILRRESLAPGEPPEELAYRQAKQDYFIKDLERYNIRAVMVDSYDQITEVLRGIETRYKGKTIFVSGAAHEYGSRWSSTDALDFVHKLSWELVARDFRLVTGLGVGIGSTVVDGALQQIYRVQRRTLRDQLIIRPFPQSVEGKQLWSAYRDDMLNFAGIAIFMFGNKLAGKPPALATSDGVVEEFRIAVEKGLKVLPLGFTEYAARTLYDQVATDFARYFPRSTPSFESLFKLLGDSTRSLTEQLKTTLSALQELERM
ncbi:MAG: SIR2 family protein [Burkholderiaceae bacterium]|nr:SIR2 family protein [Burkholderiaceae bacterium]